MILCLTVRSSLAAGLALAVIAPLAHAQSFTSSGGASSTALAARRSGNVYVFTKGRYVIYTPLPTLGINLNSNRSRSYYPFSSFGVDLNGLPPYYLGYPPYYGPRYGARWPSQSNYEFLPYEFSARPWYWQRSYDGPPLLEVARRIDPALVDSPAPTSGASSMYLPPVPTTATPPAPPVDAALVALANRDYERAAELFMYRAGQRNAIESDDQSDVKPDRTALRLHGFALAGLGQYAEAAQALARAYEEDPSLRRNPLIGDRLIDGRTELRSIVTGAVAFAHEAESADAWRMVAALMQAEGREQLAQQMLNRADVLATPTPKSPAVPSVPGGAIPPDLRPTDAPSPG